MWRFSTEKGQQGRSLALIGRVSLLMIINHSLGSYWDKKGWTAPGQIRSGPIRRAVDKTFLQSVSSQPQLFSICFGSKKRSLLASPKGGRLTILQKHILKYEKKVPKKGLDEWLQPAFLTAKNCQKQLLIFHWYFNVKWSYRKMWSQ